MNVTVYRKDLDLIELLRQYLKYYACKDLAAIAGMFSPNATLRDWKISVKGRDAALMQTQLNFINAKTIEIEILSVQAAARVVCAELRILVDGESELFVVDVLEFDEHGKVVAIRAYLGRSD